MKTVFKVTRIIKEVQEITLQVDGDHPLEKELLLEAEAGEYDDELDEVSSDTTWTYSIDILERD